MQELDSQRWEEAYFEGGLALYSGEYGTYSSCTRAGIPEAVLMSQQLSFEAHSHPMSYYYLASVGQRN